MLLSLVTLSAHAADPVGLEVIPRAQKGLGEPGLILVVNQDATRLDARVECGGAWAGHEGAAKAGERITLGLAVNPGHYACSGTLSAEFADGSAGEMPLSFEIDLFDELKVEVPRDAVDVDARTLSVVLDRTPGTVEVEVYGPRDALLSTASTPGLGAQAGEPVSIEWAALSDADEVVRIHVKGTDEHGFWSAVDLFPWSYAIPHEDVVFDSNQSLIRPDEEPKLTAAMGEVDAVREKYGPKVPMKLYVAGYTDTVGDPHANQQLSNLRAASIAAWFRDNGFEGEVWYQGFGESVLAVPTPDSTDEQANRRALYVLAAETPAISEELPRAGWQRL